MIFLTLIPYEEEQIRIFINLAQKSLRKEGGKDFIRLVRGGSFSAR
jgi:hypothetical protein